MRFTPDSAIVSAQGKRFWGLLMSANALLTNRRRAYRVRPATTDRLALEITCNNETHIPHDVADVTFNGAKLRFLKPEAPPVSNGDELLVSIRSSNLSGTATIPARVVFTENSATEQFVGLAFDGSNELEYCESERFLQLFNRRAIYRDDEAQAISEIAVAVMPLEEAPEVRSMYRANVRNLSTSGIGLDVDADTDQFLREQSAIRLGIRLAVRDRPCEIVTNVCSRTEVGERYYYGCHFSWDETRYARFIMEDLAKYAPSL